VPKVYALLKEAERMHGFYLYASAENALRAGAQLVVEDLRQGKPAGASLEVIVSALKEGRWQDAIDAYNTLDSGEQLYVTEKEVEAGVQAPSSGPGSALAALEAMTTDQRQTLVLAAGQFLGSVPSYEHGFNNKRPWHELGVLYRAWEHLLKADPAFAAQDPLAQASEAVFNTSQGHKKGFGGTQDPWPELDALQDALQAQISAPPGI
jgi:hypothetical protein